MGCSGPVRLADRPPRAHETHTKCEPGTLPPIFEGVDTVPHFKSRTPCRQGGQIETPSSPASLLFPYLPSLVQLIHQYVARQKYLQQRQEKNRIQAGVDHSERWWLSTSGSSPMAHRVAYQAAIVGHHKPNQGHEPLSSTRASHIVPHKIRHSPVSLREQHARAVGERSPAHLET